MARALEMLAEGSATTTIAIDLGYNSISGFIAFFRRIFGVTPTEHPIRQYLVVPRRVVWEHRSSFIIFQVGCAGLALKRPDTTAYGPGARPVNAHNLA